MHHNSSPYDACAIFLKSFDALCEKQTEIKSLIIFSATEALKSAFIAPCFWLFVDYQRIKLRSVSQ